MTESKFSLIKWYLDCVTDQGDTAILYCADLRWRGVHIAYSSILQETGRSVESHSSLAGFHLSNNPGEIQLEIPRLGVSGHWRADATPVERAVYESASGSVQWDCLQPRSKVNLRIGRRELTGLGYAERITLTLPPWTLPMRQLRWGRFVSEQDSLVWVDWQGTYSTSFAFCNGVKCEPLSVSDSEMATPDATLHMDESLPLRTGRLGSTILPGAPALRKLLPSSLFNIEEHKWRSRGTLNGHEHSSKGWVIHEVVHWKI